MKINHKPITDNWQLLLFGFLLSFWSTPGQTFFISLFSGEIRDEMSLSHAQFGGLYSLATLCSAIAIIWTGSLIDRVDLKKFTYLIIIGSFIGCMVISVSQTIIGLFIGIFLVRHIGQGLSTLTSVTTMVKYLEPIKGKATAISQTGYSTAEAIMPVIMITMLLTFGWRNSWQIIGVIMIVIMLPSIFLLLKNHHSRHAIYLANLNDNEHHSKKQYQRIQWTRQDVLKDKRFYLFLPSLLAQAILFTGFIFHQIHLVESKGWSLSLWGGLFGLYAGVAFCFSLIVGVLIDKVGALKLVPIAPIPMGIGLLLLSYYSDTAVAVVFMVLLGVTSGFVNTLSGPFWSQLYGNKHLASIKSLSTAMMVFASSISPFLIGWLIDSGVSIETLTFAGCIYVAIATVLSLYAYRLSRNDPNVLNHQSY